MTAEVAVMNKSAVALAADSKVTVTSGGVTKTYDTVAKLFTLSKIAPIGVMIYGNAEFMGYPWETIIKLYREEKGRQTEALVVDWSRDFFRYLARFGKISAKDKTENVFNICASTLHEVLEQFSNAAQAEGWKQGSPEYELGLREFLERRAATATRGGVWISGKRLEAVLGKVSGVIADTTEGFFGGYSDETKQAALHLLAATLFFKANSPQTSGIVIAGFGDREFFPTLIEHKVDGYVGAGIKRFQVDEVTDLSRTRTGCIRAFAQREMVYRFMSGIDPQYQSYLGKGLPELVVDNCFATLEKYGAKAKINDKNRAEIRAAVTKSVQGFNKEATQYRIDYFSDPVMRMVAVLPKDELAHLAESLVALTSLKRRVSSDAETVGGPIDVALISKGDGFIWIKRKHYFQEELNPQFVRTYMDRTGYGASNGEERGAAKSSGRAAAKAPRRRTATKPSNEKPGTGKAA
jgi:hypothetical protein